MDIKDRTNLKKANVKVNKSMNEDIVIASEQVEDQVKEMNENNLAMEEVPSSEDKPSLSQPMDGADYDTDTHYIVMTIVTMIKIMGMREGFIGLCVGRE
jgi:hypothetical protein